MLWLHSCLSLVAAHFNRLPVTAIFDRADKIDSKLAKARAYADCDPQFPGLCDLVTSAPLARGVTSRTVPAMQTADFLAWEGRKAYLPMKQWQALPDLPIGDRQARWQHYQEWTRKVTGKDPVLRKSLDALIDKIRTNAVVWDDDQLAAIHKARNGVWTQEGDE